MNNEYKDFFLFFFTTNTLDIQDLQRKNTIKYQTMYKNNNFTATLPLSTLTKFSQIYL